MPSRHTKRSTQYALIVTLGAILTLGSLIISAVSLVMLYRDDPSSTERSHHIAALVIIAAIGATAILSRTNDRKIAREEARRIAIAELLKMAMDDPDLDEAWGPVPADEDRKARRQLMYINMIISEWQMSYETKALPETRLRAISREMFSARPGRAFWRQARQVRMSTSETKRARRFHEILDEEYNRAPAPPPERQASRRPWALLAAAAAGGVVMIPVLRRPLTRRPRRGADRRISLIT